MGRAAGGSLMACLWLWTSAGALAASRTAAAPDPAAATAYRNALDLFNHADYARALALLEHAPTDGTPGELADILNLRGAIYLRQARYDQAQEEFSRAAKTDHSLWAARFNEAEVSFRQKRYAESRRQFGALLDQTSRIFHHEEYHFVEYKLLLAGICADDEKPALDFIADHRDDARPPLAWYYLNAAIEHRHDRAGKGDQWLAQADSQYAAGSGQTYAESFDRLGWGATLGRADAIAGRDAARNVRNVAIADNTVTKTPGTHLRNPPAAPDAANARTVAVVEVLPAPAHDLLHDHSLLPPVPSGAPVVSSLDLPPGAEDAAAVFAEILNTGHDAPPAPSTLARPRRSRATPAPSPADSPASDATPGVTANQGGATPAAASAATPSAEFTEKYEAAYVKFLEKNYPETLAALDEADKVQPGQSQSISLRFKAHYALAYVEYRKQNYAGALAELDLADQTQKNADSFNLRGLIFSKQRNYDQAEGMFRKAVTTDPALWAAKFNYAELPFNRGNYTDARTRFEELFSQTDATRQPREAELTQYKVFLTLLLEGKVEAASTFMDHLTFSGATPARYFCNAALNFRAGSVDKAKNWIDDAKKEFPPQLVAIFIESFYRLGWMADPNAASGTALAQATPAGTPMVTLSGTQPTSVATATAAPSPSPSVAALMAAASPTPTPLAQVTPTAAPRPAASVPPVATATPTPVAVVAATPTVAPRPAASATPVVAAATPTPKPIAVVAATPTVAPRPAASATPAVAVATPAASASPARPLALAGVSPTPAGSAPPVVVAALTTASPTVAPRPLASAPPVVAVATPTATPARSVAASTVVPTPASTPAVARATPTPAVAPSNPAASTATASAKRKAHLRFIVLFGLLVYVLYCFFKIQGLLQKRKQAALRVAAKRRAMAESSK